MRTKLINIQNDSQRMIQLACLSSQKNFHVYDLPYRLSSWALDSKENGQLWCKDDQLVAWAILQTPFWCVDYVIHPLFEESLFPIILDWVNQQAQSLINSPYGRPSWYCHVFRDQLNRISTLENNGYRSQENIGEDSWSKVLLRRFNHPLKIMYKPKLGYIVRPLAGNDEVPAYVQLHQTVFGSKNMQASWRSRILLNPQYFSDLDMVVESPDGRLVAFCIGWIMEDELKQLHGQIEPLGCHPDYRHLALGRVALCEVVNRLLKRGVNSIRVETDNYRDTAFRLYQSFDFEVDRDVLIFRKDF